MRWLDQVRQRRAELRLWAQARTLEDLGELTARWLEGRVAHQPGYHGPVDVDEDLAPGMRDTLVRLNRAGFVTNSSQAGYDNASWTSHAAVTGFARDETVQMLRPTLQRAGYAAVTDDYTDKPGGTHVTFQDGRPYTLFGGPLDKPVIEEIYPGVSAAAIDDLCGLSQLTIYDPQTGRNTLWAALDEAVRQPEQEKIVNTYDEELGACRAEYRAAKEAAKRWGDTPGPAAEVQAAEERLDRAAFALADKLDEAKSVAGTDDAPRDSVRPGLHNAPGTRFNHDPRAVADGAGGYTVTTDGGVRQARHDERIGWAMYDGDERLTGGYADPDDLFAAVLGAPHRRDEAGDIHERRSGDGSDRAADAGGQPQDGPGDLTADRRRLHDEVLTVARDTGADCRDVLLLMNAAAADKAAVADALGGPGAGAEFLSTGTDTNDHAATGSDAPIPGRAGDSTNSSTSDADSGPTVGAHADAGQTVNVPGNAIGSVRTGSRRTGQVRTGGSGSDTGVNIGAVVGRSGSVNAGGDICGQKNVDVPKPRRESGSDNVAEA